MGGRKVCFIDHDGQVGTCIREGEDCFNCDTKYEHFKWIEEENKSNISAKMPEKTSEEDYYIKLYEQVHVLEHTVYELRILISALRRTGFYEIADELSWRAGSIEEVMGKVDQLLFELVKQQTKDVSCEKEQLKRLLEK